MKKTRFVVLAAALLIAGGMPATAQQLPPIRQIGAVVTTTTEKLGAVSAVRQLPNGSVLVNDIVGRRVLLFDADLKKFTVVADTTSATGNAYGTRPGGLIQYRGDSTLFVDPASLSMLVIDGNGKIGRVMSVPRANDAQFLIGGPFGSAGFDPQGRIVYRAPPRPVFTGGLPGGGGGSGGARSGFISSAIPDSAALVRVDLATRKVDTLAFIKTPKISMQMSRDANGGIQMQSTINPLPVVDDWGILPDGTVALVRGKDYHIDWLSPEKSMTSTAKIPFEWQRLSDDDKVAFIDSTRKAMEVARASGNMGGALAGMFGGGGGGGAMMTIRTGPEGAAPGGAAGNRPTRRVPSPGGGDVIVSTPVTTGTGAAVGVAGSGGANPLGGALPGLSFVPPSELPDYKPPFSGNATRIDPEGNLWIRTSQNVKGLAVYNVVNRKGEVIDRVQLPVGRVIAGFGSGGAIFLGSREAGTARLERALLR
ncbi:MAG TPA: hypothetical protein VNJ04_15470 [Gemmatimonadaceae bacterium]|nr:hypothetical protein [Gemmatimonadaceae bacterium]